MKIQINTFVMEECILDVYMNDHKEYLTNNRKRIEFDIEDDSQNMQLEIMQRLEKPEPTKWNKFLEVLFSMGNILFFGKLGRYRWFQHVKPYVLNAYLEFNPKEINEIEISYREEAENGEAYLPEFQISKEVHINRLEYLKDVNAFDVAFLSFMRKIAFPFTIGVLFFLWLSYFESLHSNYIAFSLAVAVLMFLIATLSSAYVMGRKKCRKLKRIFVEAGSET